MHTVSLEPAEMLFIPTISSIYPPPIAAHHLHITDMKPYLLLLILLHTLPLSNGDFDALMSLKSAFLLSDWTAGGDHCSFSGVTCDPTTSRVISLNISFHPIHRPLPSSISLLHNLLNLTLSYNAITGPLPLLSSLPSLRFLNISGNNFTGAFPSLATSLPHLHLLDAYNNNFSGPLPIDLAALPNLRYLHLGGNFFSGEIPQAYSSIQSLEYLGLNGNALSGRIPPSLSNLSRLQQMYIGYFNMYEGGIPPELGLLPSLIRLDLGSCNLTGPIPETLGRLKLLDTLFLQFNRLSGPIPAELGELTRLKSLDLSVNELVGEIPESFSGLRRLMLLNLFRNHLRGGIPAFIADLPELEVLEVWENNFTLELPPALGRNGRLKKLDVATNHLTGTIPPDLCAGGGLQVLVLLENGFFGPIPEELGACKSLVHVRLAKNFLNGTIPAGFFNLPSADMIELSDNLLSGELPPVMTGDKLSMLLLSSNQISGSVPPAIGNLSALQVLSLESNNFSGEILPEIGRLVQLTKLNLSRNGFIGFIPPDLVRCSSLSSIDLSSNGISGEIPEQIVRMQILSTLNLSRNHLSGDIPSDMQHMQSLTTLDLSFNDLSGMIPLQGQFLVFNESSYAGNPRLCGGPIGACAGGTEEGRGRRRSWRKLLLPVVLAAVFIAMMAVGAAKAWKGRSSRRSGWRMTAFQRLGFKAEDVVECLQDDNVIGKGGAGIVYRGCIGSAEVAIKRLVGRGRDGEHDRGFTAEIETLGRIRHRNIVRLLGYVSSRDANLLLYEYMPNGSLGELLHGGKGAHLGWAARRRIAAEAARGICYLHHDCSPAILHRDVKSNNILLDAEMEAHVADFGLAKFIGASGASECMSSIAGSYGYIAPEYAYTLRVDEKSDVYSFGVVLLELITGRRPVGSFGDGVDVVRWVRKTASEAREEGTEPVMAVVDRRLTPAPMDVIGSLYGVAMRCVEERSGDRPTMREVVHMLSDVTAVAPGTDLVTL